LNGDSNSNKNYLLITPCKNEEENLPSLINSVVKQTIKPLIWVIIDDGSTDNTSQILDDSQNNYDWIKILRFEETPRDLGIHLAEVMQKGFEYAISICNQEEAVYYYLGNIDADLTLPPTFYENLIFEFEHDSKLGMASGGLILTNSQGKLVHVTGLPVDEPSGGDVLIRRSCFEECGGIPQSYAYDSVIKAKARLRGWDTKRFEDNIVIEARDVGNAESYFKGYWHMGKTSHYLNLHPAHILLRGILKSFKKPYYGGTIYVISYVYSLLIRDEQINDKEVRSYFWNKWKYVYSRFFVRVKHETI
jgi:glycosyltransferase involved in cell wall biosynthesis